MKIALPMKAALKKVVKGTKKWPQRKPARSNRGLGTYQVKNGLVLLKQGLGCR